MKKIAILRGINVGGRRKLPMAELKELCAELGLTDVRTYIQSGNIIFSSPISGKDLEVVLENAIISRFGFDVPVIIRTAEELQHSVEKNPFYSPKADITALHLTLLKDFPADEDVSCLELPEGISDRFVLQDKDVFIFCAGKYHKTKLSNAFFEKKLKVRTTTRNWKTILKLIELSA
ncbi:Protein of unknown function DUF1697 like protein [Aduncisulcus paluster]|uniref:DUF1697 domain-containing protein n=1 Tax=Aduncisulcus paluster TaxID=2918883 RepID=A0ABQ5KQX4_9EUKA|nr:Protein of unknown function DUF1697 like protein [Aduncisulcus paluster]